MSRTPELLAFAAKHGLRCITIADLVRYRLKHEKLVECAAVAKLSTRWVACLTSDGSSIACISMSLEEATEDKASMTF